MSVSAPIIEGHDRAALLDSLMKQLPGYVPGWLPADPSNSSALMRIFARYLEILAGGVNQVPERSLMAFLDMLGTSLLTAQAAQAPLVFTLADNAPVDVTLPANSLVAARARPASPSPLQPDRNQPSPQDALFATRQTVTLARAHLSALYCIHPGNDEYADHTTDLAKGFTLFDRMNLTEHAIYLGHDELFALGGENIVVMLSFSLERFASRALKTQWEYLTEGGWSLLESSPQDDTTSGMKQDGLIMLRRDCGPKAKQDSIEGRTAYWLRGRLTTPLLPDGPRGERTVPVINDIRARVGFTRSGIAPEAAFLDGVPLDTSKDFYPFGPQPATYTTFYLACKEVFQRRGATVKMDVTLRHAGVVPTNTAVELAWEYFDGTAWQDLGKRSSSVAGYIFTSSSILSFDCPPDWAETDVNGAKNYWLRVRIIKDDFGQGVTIDTTKTPPTVTPNADPPVVQKVTFDFTYLTDPFELDHCLSNNDFVFEDHTEDCRWPHRTFAPFRPVADAQPAVHFGFDKQLPTGLISMYVDVPEEAEARPKSSPFIWEYRSERGWTELGVLDETLGFRRSGMIQFIVAPNAMSAPGLGKSLYRVRARLKQGESVQPLPVSGVRLNAVWADQRTPPAREELGSSDGNPGQTFTLQRTPVLKGETIEVREWQGRGESWRTTLDAIPDSDLRFERDPAAGTITAAWVTWHGQPHLYLSHAGDRHYTVERAGGMVRFGDGQRGLIPPAGSQLIATYSSGGGVAGNVPAGAITELRMALPFIQSAANPIPASGGADKETIWGVKQRGPQRLRHHDRAVSAEDCEWLVREASPDVARVRCLPITGPAGHAQRGWITLVVAPYSPDPQPQPSPGFGGRVCDYLTRHVPATLASRVRIVGPQYTPVGVQASIVPHTPGEAAQVEARVRGNLNRFLHPLDGGPDGQGWAFGQAVHLSQIARVIEETPGVAYAQEIRLGVGDQVYGDMVPMDAYTLVAAGDHELKLSTGTD